MSDPVDIRSGLVDVLRRNLIGPGPEDADLAAEKLDARPSSWYLAGYLAPAEDKLSLGGAAEEADADEVEDGDIGSEDADDVGAGGVAGDNDPPDAANARRRFLPSSIGLTVLLDPDVKQLKARVSWGDYRTEPPLPDDILEPEEGDDGARRATQHFHWVRSAKTRDCAIDLGEEGRARPIVVPESAPEQGKRSGGLTLEVHSRLFDLPNPVGGRDRRRAVTVFLVNRRPQPAARAYADLRYVFQARLELECETGFSPRQDLSGYAAADDDLAIADLHYRDVREWAVGRNAAAGWTEADGQVTKVWTEALPTAEVERVAPNESIAGVTFGMEALAGLAERDGAGLTTALWGLPALYGAWINGSGGRVPDLAPGRRETARTLVADMARARERIVAGITLLETDARARRAFAFMNLAVARAARRREAGANGDPSAMRKPTWRPFQLAFILLNLTGLTDKHARDREIADLLFFPTGGGKTEAYLGLAAYAIAQRRLSGPGVAGAGVSVIMRYTLRLLTLDQLGRAAGVVCALELMRADPANVDDQGRRLLGDWPIEIGLWVGSDASPNRLGGRGNTGDDTAVTRVRLFKRDGKRPPAPIKACPWCGAPFNQKSFECVPDMVAPTNLEIRCGNPDCDFTRGRPLPIVTVDEAIYRRLPAFIIATVDKFAALPWVGQSGAFFGHVDRYQPNVGFFGAADPVGGMPLQGRLALDPPDLIIQDELHLIAGPLGTVAGLYEAAIDQLAARGEGEDRVRPKIVASTATVRRASDQIRALFDRHETRIFPPPGIDRADSFFAQTVPASTNPARLYLGVAAQGRGPKLVFLRTLTTLLSAAQAAYEAEAKGLVAGNPNPADPYMTAVCYFNALRELGGARRIVEDEVTDQTSSYATRRRRLDPLGVPFANRKVRLPLELTSRVSTDDVAKAKRALEQSFGKGGAEVDVALATNMISVGLDILRLGLMLVQGQPKTAAEYIQATSRVGRDHNRPGLVVTVLNVHKPRDRAHYEQFGHFHRTFYRAVEATSVTPWAARALDRALAAVVVAAARHGDPALTPDNAAARLRDHPSIRQTVRDALLARAPAGAVAGGHAALGAQIEALLDDWTTTADDQTQGGANFTYGRGGNRLLHQPLEPGIGNLSAAHRRFIAGRSMRDVEPPVQLFVKSPWGGPIEGADDV